MASIAVGALGAGLGFLAGGPAGARLGWAVGTVVGGLLFPPRSDAQVGKLDNLHINLSSQGAAIPMIWGAMRLGANIIWATDLVEKKGGSKGGPTTYRYYANAAALVCAGPITQINKIYANDLLIYDVSQTHPTKYTIRIYTGSETQMPDSLIEAHQGVGTTPAYRGSCYVVFENFDVTDFGNQLPNFSFEVLQSATATMADVLSGVAAQMGLSTGQTDFSAATDALLGYKVDSRTTGASAIEPLLQNVGDLIESDGKLRYVPRGQAAVATVLEGELGASHDTTPVSRVEIRRAEELTLPSQVDLVYYSPTRQYQQETQTAQRMTKPHVTDKLTVNYPGALTDDAGRQRAHRTLYTAWLEREQYRYFLPPKYIYVTPGDVLNIPTATGLRRLRCNDVELDLPGAIAVTGVLDAAPVITQTVSGGSTPPATSTANLAPVPTTFLPFGANAAGNAIELQQTDGFYAGFYVSAGGPSGWRGATIYYSSDGGTNWIEAGSVSQAGSVGVSTSALATFGGTNPDTTNSAHVTLSCGALEPASQSEVNAGLNQALLGNEVLGYTGALLGSGTAYTLSSLTRAEVGTLTTGHASGERFCTLPGAVRITVPDALQGQTLQVKCVSPYQTLSDVTAQNVTVGTKSGGPPANVSGLPTAGTGPTTPIAATGAAGTSANFAPYDHTHQGVHKITGPSGDIVGDVLIDGSGVSQTGNHLTISGGGGTPATTVTEVGATGSVGTGTNYAREDHVHKGVHKITGSADASGDLVFNGSGVSQSGNTFTFSGGSSSAWVTDETYNAAINTLDPQPSHGYPLPNLSTPIVYMIATGGTTITFELPTSGAAPIVFKIIDSAAYTVTIHANHTASGQIDGASSRTLSGQYKCLALIPAGVRSGVVDWLVLWSF